MIITDACTGDRNSGASWATVRVIYICLSGGV